MPVISEDQVREIRERTDIIDLLADYGVRSQKRSGRYHLCLCPFHEDHSPSLQVDPERQRYRCWPCGAHGDVIDFVMQIQGVNFPESVEILARRLGIEIRYEKSSAAEVKAAKARGEWRSYLYELNELAVQFYKARLKSEEGRAAREYLSGRDVAEKSIDDFNIGWSPASGSALFNFMRKKGASREALLAAGLVAERGGETRDYFYAQLMFPFRDTAGHALGFSGRLLPGDSREIGKYINTRNTLVFSKSKSPYAIEKMMKSTEARKKIIVVEGQLDVVLCHQHGFRNVVGLGGSSMPREGLRILRRLSRELVLLTDGDRAGRDVPRKVLPTLLELGFPARVGILPPDADPADMLTSGKEKQLAEIIENSVEIFSFVLENILENVDIGNPHEVSRVAAEMMRAAAYSKDTVVRQVLRKQIAQRLLLEERSLEFPRVRSEPEKPTKPDMSDGGVEQYPKPETLQGRAERELLSAVLRNLELVERLYDYSDLNIAAMEGPGNKELGLMIEEADATVERQDDQALTLQDILDKTGGNLALRRLAEELAELPRGSIREDLDPVAEFDKSARKVCSLMVRRRMEGTRRELAKALQESDREAVETLEKKYAVLSEKLRRYQSPQLRAPKRRR